QWLGLSWIAGATIFVLIAAAKASRTNSWLWRQRRPLSAELQIGIEKLFSGLDFKTLPKVWLVEGIGQPFVWGLLRGSIYLPADFAKVNSAEHRRSVLGHELSHIIRFDAAVNILQIIAQAVFWFHPFVWWANKKIRAEREKCCDEMTIARIGAKVKDYSTAIVNILISEHESTRSVPSLAVAGPVKNIEERIKTMLRPGKKFYKRPSWRAIIVLLLVAVLAVPTTIALTKRMEGAESAGSRKVQVIVTGKVISEQTGEALVDALVRVAVPATDMRFMRGVRDSARHAIYEGRTDQNGRFRIEVPLGENTADISLDAFLPRYRSAAGTFRSGGDFSLAKVSIQPEQQADFLIRLPSALYIAGVVKDHNGRPFAGVQVEATMWFDRGSGGIARTSTDQNGRFEIFDYPVPAKKKRKDERGQLAFRVETAKTVTIKDIYKMTEEQLRSLDVQMPRGLVASGVLLDVNGKPIGETTVEAMDGPMVLRRCKTDQNGRFRLAGLRERKPLTLYAHAMSLKQKAKMTLVLVDRDKEVILRCEMVKLKAPLKTVTMLGMKVADITPEIKEIYDMPPFENGVVILDPGKNYERLGIGELCEGYSFWIVGDKEINNVREMIAEILRINNKPIKGGMISEGHKGFIRIVYVRRDSTSTQYLKLTDDDIAELMSLTSASILSRLGKALIIYATDHQDRYPDTISQVESYLKDKQDFEWIVQNVVYLGKGKPITGLIESPIAYDRALLTVGSGTNVLFGNTMVSFRSAEQLEKLDIRKP
ncbi:MAG: M56 family metallopeptidase, partial [Sedimentisphaerales bacterium]